jgi:hypothetical protein
MTSTLSSSEQQAIADLGAAVPWMAALVEVEQPLYRVAEMWPLSEPEWAVRCSPASVRRRFDGPQYTATRMVAK